jgi:phytoene/squalene synthetase
MISDEAVRADVLERRRPTKHQASARLARRITLGASKQSYLIAGLLASSRRRNDCYRAYAYFRWVDDVVDEVSQTRSDRIGFVRRQRSLVNRLLRDRPLPHLTPEERMLADLMRNRTVGLDRYIDHFLAIIEFDAERKGQSIDAAALNWYSETLGTAVTDAIEYFIGDGSPYPDSPSRYLAATAAHITHMLRDLVEDVSEGYVNVPREYLEIHRVAPTELDSLPMRMWVMDRVKLARSYFRLGKRYLLELDDLRSKLAGFWYCARFEGVLDAIEREGYVLRANYPERRSLWAWIKMIRIGVSVVLHHAVRRLRPKSRSGSPSSAPSQV